MGSQGLCLRDRAGAIRVLLWVPAPLSLQLCACIVPQGLVPGAPGQPLSWESVPRTAQSLLLFQESEHGMCLISSCRKYFLGCSISLVNSPSLTLFFRTAVSFIFRKDLVPRQKKKGGNNQRESAVCSTESGMIGVLLEEVVIPVGANPAPALGCRWDLFG